MWATLLLLLPVLGVLAGPEPDLVVDADVLRASLSWDVISNRDPCLVAEGCLLAQHPNGLVWDDAHEMRKLLRFSTRIWNVGAADLHLGMPPAPEGSGPPAAGLHVDPWWEYSGCHDHYHLSGYAVHDLLHPGNASLVEELGGSKTGFCMRDNMCQGGAEAKYDCNSQGITAGCADHYGSELACQWLDITDVPPGRYILRVRVNANGFLSESNHSNNAAEVEFDTRTLRRFEDPVLTYWVLGLVGLMLIACYYIVMCCWCAAERARASASRPAGEERQALVSAEPRQAQPTDGTGTRSRRAGLVW